VVLADEAFAKGSPRPGCSSTPHRPRHRQAGWKSFRAVTFDADEAQEFQALFEVRFPMPARVTLNIHDRILKLWKLACVCHWNLSIPLERIRLSNGVHFSTIKKLGVSKLVQWLDKKFLSMHNAICFFISSLVKKTEKSPKG
jgi:hypothetical protein